MTRRSAAHHLHAALFELNEAFMNGDWTAAETKAYSRAVAALSAMQTRYPSPAPRIEGDVFRTALGAH